MKVTADRIDITDHAINQVNKPSIFTVAFLKSLLVTHKVLHNDPSLVMNVIRVEWYASAAEGFYVLWDTDA